MTLTAADRLGGIIIERDDFIALYAKIERIIANSFLGAIPSDTIYDTDVNHLLRYADILSLSNSEHHKELSYSIIAMLKEFDSKFNLEMDLHDRLVAFSEAILVELGNFPGLQTLQKSDVNPYALPMSRETMRVAKEVLQRTSNGNGTLTDTQFEITQHLKAFDYFSFSGPTSLGKSFIIKNLLHELFRNSDFINRCVVILVPTKALIGQVATDLRELLSDTPQVNVATFPSLPLILRNQYQQTVFVFTPERLLRYLANPSRDIVYLVIDEAHKIIAPDDTRAPLYYHAITETLRRFATKLLFSSPNINNPQIFLELFGKSKHGALSVKERTVSQNRYLVDLVENKQYYFSTLNTELLPIEGGITYSNAEEAILSLAGNSKSIIYVNSSTQAVEFARELANRLSSNPDDNLRNLADYVNEYVHKDYFLGGTLKRGVAFHHGKMPQEIRERIENEFAKPDSQLRFVVCTSTLLEGINLPAKNIFVISDKHGNKHFTKIDFENLAGRAGRLTYDFSGNVICIRVQDHRWTGSTRELIPRNEQITAESFLVNPPRRRRKEYTDIAHVLRGENIPGEPSHDRRATIEQYASILTLHQIDDQPSTLRENFLSKIDNSSSLLDATAHALPIDPDILRVSPGIPAQIQAAASSRIAQSDDAPLLPDDADLSELDTHLNILKKISSVYNWRTTEVSGSNPLMPSNTDDSGWERRLTYWAILMRSWINGSSLSKLIKSSINFHNRTGTITYRIYYPTYSLVTEQFDPDSPRHINIIIEETLKDLENGLKFKIIGYLDNYFDICVRTLGAAHSGVNVAMLVEFGTADPLAVQLQEIGFSRSVATELLINYKESLQFSYDEQLMKFDYEVVLNNRQLSEEARKEIETIMEKDRPRYSE